LPTKSLPDYHLVGRKYIRFGHDEAHPFGSIETVAVGGDGRAIGPWRQVFDLDTYNKTAPQPYTIKWINPTTECLAPEYSRCMLPLWWPRQRVDNASGSRWCEKSRPKAW
jgi:prolyl oligopeptidase